MSGILALVMMTVTAVVTVVSLWRIMGKAGLPPWFSLLALIPFLNLAVLLYVAYSKWPALESNGV